MEQNWTGLIIISMIILSVIVILILTSIIKEKKLQRAGILPAVQNTTDEDIKRLANSPYRIWAIKRYRQIYKVSLKEAKRKIEELVSTN